MSTEAIIKDCLAAVRLYENTGPMPFAWPLDALCAEPWQYAVHCAWVGVWNAEDRATPCVDHLRAWLTPANVEAATKSLGPGSTDRRGQG